MDNSIIITPIKNNSNTGPKEKLINSGLINATTDKNTVSMTVVNIALNTMDFSCIELYIG